MLVTLSRSLAVAVALAMLSGCGRETPVAPPFAVTPARPADPGSGGAPLFTIQLPPPPAALRTLATHRADVEDPVYRRAKHYEGYRLSEMVERLAPAQTSLTDAAHLVMVCLDGYRAPLTLGAARSGGGILATRDLDVKGSWEDLPAGTAVRTPAPFYLVWPSSATTGDVKRPWPYGVVGIEVWLADPVDRARPSSTDAAVRKGYDVFMQKCISCHSVNGAGGTLGAELNTPVNVTEYWNRAALEQFIRDPASVRARSKMPQLPSLTDDERRDVLVYLTAMKDQKIVAK
jgi:mono/diheme cytochrome c family protein